MDYGRLYSTRKTPQTEKIPGSAQVPNSAGGFSFAVSPWQMLDRFLILGSEKGSYYADEKKLTAKNAEGVLGLIKIDGPRVVRRIVDVSDQALAPKNDPAIFALAMCLKHGDEETRRLAAAMTPKVCRIGTHIFQLAENVKAFGGWGPVTRRAIRNWYENYRADPLALMTVKYQQRNGWSHRDLLRKAHPVSQVERGPIYRWVTHGKPDAFEVKRATKRGERIDKYPAVPDALPEIIKGFERMQAAPSPLEAASLIAQYGIPRECVPTNLLNSPEVWEALLMSGQGMPYTAMIRNLGKMASIGLLAPMSAAESYVVSRLANKEGMKKARVHPLGILLAQSVYSGGRGIRGSLTWQPSPKVIDALNDAFYESFQHIVPTGMRTLLAIDVSSSMDGGSVAGTPLTCREAAAAMAMVTARTEPQYGMLAFAERLVQVPISPKTRLDDAVKIMQRFPFGGTDCALPMIWADQHDTQVDAFVVYTDSETWAGTMHPTQALQRYREHQKIPAKLAVVAFTANEFTIADPNDFGMMDFVGFDASAPALLADFIRG